MSRGRLVVVGTGPAPAYVTPAAAGAIRSCEVFVGGDAALRSAPAWGERVRVAGSMAAVTTQIDRHLAAGRDVCVLTSGDPGYFSLLTAIERNLPGEAVVEPGISSVQLLAARVGVSWQEFSHYSVHGRELALDPEPDRPFAVLCGGSHSAEVVAAHLLEKGLDAYAAVGVCLGGDDEEVTVGPLAEVASATFGHPAVVLVAPRVWIEARGLRLTPRLPAPSRGAVDGTAGGAAASTPGIPDEAFERSERVPLSRWEVRAVLAAVTRPGGRRVIWDVGAGSGGFAVELALQAPAARVIAFERDPVGCEATRRNAALLGARVEVVQGEAPSILPPGSEEAPDLVVVGGSGGRLEALLSALAGRVAPGGRVVVTSVTLETQGTAARLLSVPPWTEFDALQLASARLDRAGIMKGMNPVTLLWADKERVG